MENSRNRRKNNVRVYCQLPTAYRGTGLLVLFIILSIVSQTFAFQAEEIGQPDYAEAIKAFDEYVKKRRKVDQVPGLSIGFIKKDFMWARGYGYSDMENKVPARPESSIRLASITKTITATAVLQLMEAGKISLDAEVQAYVPYFPEKKWPVTIRMLLGHLAGISHYKDFDREGHFKHPMNTKAAIAVFQDFDLIAEPGTKYNYSSYGFNLLGAVIEEVSGQSYGQYIKAHIFNPLSMNASGMESQVDLIPNRVRGYRLINGEVKNSEYVDISSRFAGGGVRSTVVDLLKYARGICEKKLLKPETWQRLFISMATKDGKFTGYGMGWGVEPLRGHFKVSHGGGQPETSTYLMIFPHETFAIAVAANLERCNLIPYVQYLAELVLRQDIDGAVFVVDPAEQALYNACGEVFSHGLSQYDFYNRPIAEKDKDLKRSFEYFNRYVSKNYILKNSKEARKKLQSGIHPAAGRAFAKVGSYMAAALEKAYGEKRLHSYFHTGTLAFFTDYLELKDEYTFRKELIKLISSWQQDWEKSYPRHLHDLHIFADTDIRQLERELKNIFSAAGIYPDFSRDMEDVAKYFLRQSSLEKTTSILELSNNLYPENPNTLNLMAATYIWEGNIARAEELYIKAHSLVPVSLERLELLASGLKQAKKHQELFGLAQIAVSLFPENAKLVEDIGDLAQELGKKDLAVKYYQKALKLDPTQSRIKNKLKQLKKKSLRASKKMGQGESHFLTKEL